MVRKLSDGVVAFIVMTRDIRLQLWGYLGRFNDLVEGHESLTIEKHRDYIVDELELWQTYEEMARTHNRIPTSDGGFVA